AAARRAPGRATDGVRRAPLQLPEDPHDAAEDLHVPRIERLHRRVLRLQADAVLLAVERLHRRRVERLVVAGERDDDLAVPRVLRALHDHEVAVEDARLDHRLALRAHDEVALREARHRDVLLDVLLGEQRTAGGDLAEDRQACHVAELDDVVGLAPLAAEQLQRTRLRRVALQQARALEVREVRVHRRGRGEPYLLADLAHGRRVAVPVDVLDEVVPDLLLAGGEQETLLGVADGDERVFAIRVESPADVVKRGWETRATDRP